MDSNYCKNVFYNLKLIYFGVHFLFFFRIVLTLFRVGSTASALLACHNNNKTGFFC